MTNSHASVQPHHKTICSIPHTDPTTTPTLPPHFPTPTPPPTHPRMPGHALLTMCCADVGRQTSTVVPDYLVKPDYELCKI